MNKIMKEDLALLPDLFEDIKKGWDKLSLKEQIDAAARLNSIKNICEKLVEHTKDTVKLKFKAKKLAEGIEPGTYFNAVLTEVPTHRLDQTMLKIDYARAYNACNKAVVDRKINFTAR